MTSITTLSSHPSIVSGSASADSAAFENQQMMASQTMPTPYPRIPSHVSGTLDRGRRGALQAERAAADQFGESA
ncbi:MAG: hypothetical protein AAFV53_04460 [Myxococcota bacterium]